MRRAYYLVALAAITTATLPACGGKTQSRSALAAEIKAAVRSSQQTYFAFSNPLYWGRPVHFKIDRIRISRKDDHFAAARVLALEANGKRVGDLQQQQVLLRRSEKWLVAQAAPDGRTIFCEAASSGVVHELFGGCESTPVDTGMSVYGPHSDRAATAKERAAIIEATKAFHTNGFGSGSCVRYHIRVSQIDDRFAVVGYTFVPPYTNCLLGNGESLMQRKASGRWQVKAEGSDAFDCGDAPPGVIRSLFSGCWVYRD